MVSQRPSSWLLCAELHLKHQYLEIHQAFFRNLQLPQLHKVQDQCHRDLQFVPAYIKLYHHQRFPITIGASRLQLKVENKILYNLH
jgi:hypothetical protein